MKVVMLMFDTLNRRSLSAYGNKWIKTPNFDRLAEKTVMFNNFFSGSLPCMPARRELHTGRYNFLHRSWGPMEPFDFSMPETLKNNGIYTHLVTDHSHYFEDGGATYHNRYNTWEGFRGQEGDRWKGKIGDIDIPEQIETGKKGISFKQNWINRNYQKNEEEFSGTKVINAGIEFITENINEDKWFLQIECFDPHEPFYSPEKYKELYKHEYNGKFFDWPSYKPVTESEEEIEHLNYEYAALLSMCDAQLGKVLDTMDKYNMWKDTMLIVNTDHGFLLGEHGWLGKNMEPVYNEVAHIPFFIWDPRFEIKNETRNSLAQTIDLPATILEYFNVELPETMQGKPLRKAIEKKEDIRKAGLFGIYGGHINVVNNEYIYMRAPICPENTPLYEYTLMPAKMRGFFSKKQLENTELVNGFKFTNGISVLKTFGELESSLYRFGNKLFHRKNDPLQEKNLDNIEAEEKLTEIMRELMLESEAPDEQYERIGIYKDRKITAEELTVQKEARIKREKSGINENIIISDKVLAQINIIKGIIRNKEDRKYFLKEINSMYEEKKVMELKEEDILKIADSVTGKLNLGDKKKVLMDSIKYADVKE
ncbi:Arylsulfatase [Sebaldella termitidis]|uniref:Sulfatase n=1 Tax=Sebaldella termitidis (strain ATCC 33386 / NCTC 11300) TaxID=526218 RepID=D1AK33_SEBTE|nr:sulfatase [Sebaldella termitidis]ACZ08949.1 sulfatase [Sebaldella termitidis ATCC 33386]SUI24269.1 Arylsulfatase [Sebaldella termitidis]